MSKEKISEIRLSKLRAAISGSAAAPWKKRAEQHGCNAAEGDLDCG